MALDTDSTVDINVPKIRNLEDDDYTYTLYARDVSVRTTEVGWAILRSNKATGDTDWANDETGRGTKKYNFTASISGVTFGES